jgi:hypothetical protein
MRPTESKDPGAASCEELLIQGISAMIASPFHSERSEGICLPKANAFPLCHLERSRSACDDGVERPRAASCKDVDSGNFCDDRRPHIQLSESNHPMSAKPP